MILPTNFPNFHWKYFEINKFLLAEIIYFWTRKAGGLYLKLIDKNAIHTKPSAKIAKN